MYHCKSCSNTRKTTLLIVGFDGMDYHLAKKTIEKHRFHNFKPILRLMKVKRVFTGPSWASFYTGLDEKEHGVSDCWGRDLGKSNSFNDIGDYVFWEIIKKKGYKVLTENLPITPEGFPFDSNPKKDIVNWVQRDNVKHMDFDRSVEKKRKDSYDVIKNMDFDEIIEKTEKDSFAIINGLELKDKDLIFIQFSFLDRIGHRVGFKKDTVISKCYDLAYSIMDKLYSRTAPKYFIAVSDHGFGSNRLNHTRDYDAVLILNEAANRYFNDRISILDRMSKIFNERNLKGTCHCLFDQSIDCFFDRLSEFIQIRIFFQIEMFNINYVDQTSIFNKVLKMFNIDFVKPIKIEKKTKGIFTEEEKIKERLRKLGYID